MISFFPGATRFALLSACPWLSYFAPLALRTLDHFRAFGGADVVFTFRQGLIRIVFLLDALQIFLPYAAAGYEVVILRCFRCLVVFAQQGLILLEVVEVVFEFV